MAITFHASTINTVHNPANGSTQTPTKPTTSTGDILLTVFGVNTAITAATLTAPAGWTEVGPTGGVTSTKVRTQVFWALESVASLGFTINGGNGVTDLSWVCLSFSGVDNTSPIDATGTGASNTGSASITPANYSTVTDGALPLVGITDWNAGGAFTSTGYTVKPSSNVNCQMALLYRNTTVSPAGTVTGVSISDSAGATGNILVYQQFALRPTASAAQDTPELYGRPFGLQGYHLLHQLLSQ